MSLTRRIIILLTLLPAIAWGQKSVTVHDTLSVDGVLYSATHATADSLKALAEKAYADSDYKQASDWMHAAQAINSYINQLNVYRTYSARLRELNEAQEEIERINVDAEKRKIHLKQQQYEQDILEMHLRQEQLQKETVQKKLNHEKTQLASKSLEKQVQLKKLREERTIEWQRGRRLFNFMCIALAFMLALLIFSVYYAVNMVNDRLLRNAADSANENARRAEHMKTLFLQNLNHEIRLPLSAIISFSDLLNSDVQVSEEEQKQLHDAIHSNTDLLLTLLDDVMDLSSLQSGNYKLSYEQVSLTHLCETTMRNFESRKPEQVALHVDCPKQELIIDSDSKRLMQVIGNLISNACKYTEEGSITLAYRLSQKQGFVDIAVSDTGTGVHPDKAKDIFNRFETLGTVKKGFGLGLSICQSIVELMHGSIRLDSSYTKGARFVVSLPIKHVESEDNTKHHFSKAALTACFLLLPFVANAQNNAYEIDDRIYELYTEVQRNNNPDVTIPLVERGIQLADSIHDVKGKCILLTNLTNIYLRKDDLVNAIKCNNRCRAYTEKTPYKQYIYSGWGNLISYYFSANRPTDAMLEIKEFEKSAIATQNGYGLTRAHELMGQYYLILEQPDLAKKQFDEAIKVCEETHDTKNISRLYIDQGRALAYGQRFESAEKAYLQAIDSARIYSQTILARIYLATAYVAQGKTEKAAPIMAELDSLYVNNLYPVSSVSGYKYIKCRYLIEIGEIEESKYWLSQVTPRDSIRLQRLFYQRAGDYKAFYHELQKQIYLDDSISKRSSDSRVTDLLVRISDIEAQRVAAEKTQAIDEKRLQMLESERKKLLLKAQNDSLLLVRANLELANHEADEEFEMQRKVAMDEEIAMLDRQSSTQRMNRRMTTILILGILIVMVCSTILLYYQRKRGKKLLVRAQEAMLRSEESDKQKTQFLQDMNHEIRTPLNGILGFTDMLASEEFRDCISDEERQEMQTSVHDLSTQLQKLVEDVLDMSKLESGTYVFKRNELDVYKTAQMCIDEIMPLVKPNVEVQLHVEEGMPMLVADIARIKQVVTNLLSNAAKFTTDGYISLDFYKLEETEKSVRIRCEVTDTGCGIPAGQEETVFNRFMKLNPFDNAFGLGLSICRAIVESIGGRIWAEAGRERGAKIIVDCKYLKVVKD